MEAMSRVLRALVVLVVVFLLMPVVYELLRSLMPMIFMLIGILVISRILLHSFQNR